MKVLVGRRFQPGEGPSSAFSMIVKLRVILGTFVGSSSHLGALLGPGLVTLGVRGLVAHGLRVAGLGRHLHSA